MYVYVYVCIHTHSLQYKSMPMSTSIATYTGVCDNTLLLREPLPRSPAAETALQPPIWCSES